MIFAPLMPQSSPKPLLADIYLKINIFKLVNDSVGRSVDNVGQCTK